MERPLLTTTDVALRLRCSTENIRALERAGKLPAQKTARGQRLFKAEDVERLAEIRAKAKDEKRQKEAA